MAKGTGKNSAVEIFGERLRAARELRGLNQRELSERLGVPPSSIAHFEGGRRKPSFDSILRVATALDVTTDYLLGRAEAPVALAQNDPMVTLIAQLNHEDRQLMSSILARLRQRHKAQ